MLSLHAGTGKEVEAELFSINEVEDLDEYSIILRRYSLDYFADAAATERRVRNT